MSRSIHVDLPRDRAAPRRARRAIERLDPALDPEVQADVALLVSELVTNSVKYGADGDLHLRIEAAAPSSVRVGVIDEGGGFDPPRERSRPATEPGGWGLRLVDALADRWGVQAAPSSHVWFEIDRQPAIEPSCWAHSAVPTD